MVEEGHRTLVAEEWEEDLQRKVLKEEEDEEDRRKRMLKEEENLWKM